MNSLFFNFHGIAGVRVNTQNAEAAMFFAQEYAHHRVEALPPDLPLVTLNFGAAAPAGRAFSHHSHKALARWFYAIDLSERQITLFANGNRFAVPMIHHMMVHSSLRYLVSYQNTLLLHSGGVALNGQSILFTGRGGAGKTTTTSMILSGREPVWELHADDYAFIRPGQGTLAYLTRAHLYRDLLSWIPGLSARLSPGERLRLEVFGRLRRWSGDRLKWPVRIGLDRLWPGHALCQRAAPAALVLLRRERVAQPQLTSIQAGPEQVDELLEMNFYETRHFLTLLAKHCPAASVAGWVNDWRERERSILSAWIQQVPVYELALPVRGQPREQMARFINDHFAALILPEYGGRVG